MIKPKFILRPLTKQRAYLELTLAGALWGFGFIAAVWALRGLNPAALTFYRFFFAFVVGWLILAAMDRKNLFADWRLGLVPGFFIWATLILQTWGLLTTTATNSGFITTLYIVIVPLIRSFSHKERLSNLHWIWVGFALAGTGLIVQVQNMNTWRIGDFLTLLCAFGASFHILSVDKRAKKAKSEFGMNVYQSFWAMLLSTTLIFWQPGWDLGNLNLEGWLGLLSLAFASSMLAFYLQVRAQKVVPPSTASLLFLLESPFSALFAFILLQESLNFHQWIGAGLILLACVGVTRPSKTTKA